MYYCAVAEKKEEKGIHNSWKYQNPKGWNPSQEIYSYDVLYDH